MSEQLWRLCIHGEAQAHVFNNWPLAGAEWCPGGHPVEAERLKWCEEHRMPVVGDLNGEVICREVLAYRPADSTPCRMVERFLIPLSNTETTK